MKAIAVFDPPRISAYYLSGRIQESLEPAEARLAEDPESEDAQETVWAYRGWLGIYNHEVWQFWEDDWRDAPETWSFDDIATLIDMRRSFDFESDISDLLSVTKESARREIDAGIIVTGIRGKPYYVLGLATFLEGDRDRGIELIGEAMDFGYVIPLKMAYLQSLYNDPGFKPMLAAQEARLTSERNQVLNIVCNDNPYQSFWQPEEGTCEQFLAETGK